MYKHKEKALESANKIEEIASKLDINTQGFVIKEVNEIKTYLENSDPVSDALVTLRLQLKHQKKAEQIISSNEEKLKEHIFSIEKLFINSDNYLKSIQLGGYAAFFGLWAIGKSHVNDLLALTSVCCMLISIFLFCAWEIYKYIYILDNTKTLSYILPRKESNTKSMDFMLNREKFIESLSKKINISPSTAIKIRPFFLTPSLILGALALAIFFFSVFYALTAPIHTHILSIFNSK